MDKPNICNLFSSDIQGNILQTENFFEFFYILAIQKNNPYHHCLNHYFPPFSFLVCLLSLDPFLPFIAFYIFTIILSISSIAKM